MIQHREHLDGEGRDALDRALADYRKLSGIDEDDIGLNDGRFGEDAVGRGIEELPETGSFTWCRSTSKRFALTPRPRPSLAIRSLSARPMEPEGDIPRVRGVVRVRGKHWNLVTIRHR